MRYALPVLLAFVVVMVPSSSGQAPGPDECRSTVGIVAAISSHSISVKDDIVGTQLFQVDANTKFCCGPYDTLAKLRVGDDVMLSCVTNKIGGVAATDILANFTRWGGTLTDVHPGSLVIVGDGGPGDAPGHVQVFFNDHTVFVEGKRKDLKVGRFVEASGSIVGHKRVAASALDVWPFK